MAYDEQLADRIRDYFSGHVDVTEKRMMGALVFMTADHMTCGVTGDTLMIRVGTEGQEEALAQPHASMMNMGNGRTMKGFIRVDPEGLQTTQQLAEWINRASVFVATLPPRKRKS